MEEDLEVLAKDNLEKKEFEKKEDNEYLHNIITSIYNFDLNEIEQVQTTPELGWTVADKQKALIFVVC